MRYRSNQVRNWFFAPLIFGLCALILLNYAVQIHPYSSIDPLQENQTPFPNQYTQEPNHNPIEIQNDLDFITSNFTGDGLSWENPYKISNLCIDMYNSTNGILLNNSIRYCLIENCIIINSYWINTKVTSAIRIRNSSHLEINNCSIVNRTGSYGRGFLVEFASDILIQDCSADEGDYGGIFSKCSDISIENCSFLNLEKRGLLIRESQGVKVNNSRFRKSIDIEYLNNIIIENCSFLNDGCASIDSSNNILIQNVKVRAESGWGGMFSNCTAITFTSNEIDSSLYVYNCRNFIIDDNQFQKYSNPLTLVDNYNFTIIANTFRGWKSIALRFHYHSNHENPESSDLTKCYQNIEKNIFFISGNGVIELSEEPIPIVHFRGNIYIPNLMYIMILISLVYIGFVISKMSIRIQFMKLKIKEDLVELHHISPKVSKSQFITIELGFNQVFQALLDFQQKSAIDLLIGTGILIPLSLKSVYYDVSFIKNVIGFLDFFRIQIDLNFTSIQLYNQIAVIFLWILTLIIINNISKKNDYQLKHINVLNVDMQYPSYKNRTIIYVIAAVLFWGLLFFLINWGFVYYLNIIFAALFGGLFLGIVFRNLIKHKNLENLPWEFIAIALIFLIGGIWIIAYVASNSSYYGVLFEIVYTTRLIRWTTWLAAFAVWIHGQMHMETLSLEAD